MSEEEPQYEVGYGKPPESTRFRKGKSGNPKGRPKGSKNLSTIVLKESRRPVRMNGPHGSRTVTKLEATVMQMSNKSAQGDLRASREFLNLIQRSEEFDTTQIKTADRHEADRKTMQNLLRRMQNALALQTKDKE